MASRYIPPQGWKDWRKVSNKAEAFNWHKIYTPWFHEKVLEKLCSYYKDSDFTVSFRETLDKDEQLSLEFQKLFLETE